MNVGNNWLLNPSQPISQRNETPSRNESPRQNLTTFNTSNHVGTWGVSNSPGVQNEGENPNSEAEPSNPEIETENETSNPEIETSNIEETANETSTAGSETLNGVSFEPTPENPNPWNLPGVKSEFLGQDVVTTAEYTRLAAEGKVPPPINGTEATREEWRAAAEKGTIPPVRAELLARFYQDKGGIPPENNGEPTGSETTLV
jgi:hypothetical protein